MIFVSIYKGLNVTKPRISSNDSCIETLGIVITINSLQTMNSCKDNAEVALLGLTFILSTPYAD